MPEEITMDEFIAATKAIKRKRKDPEHKAQVALIKWARFQPKPVCLLHAIPNGGRRTIATGKRMKAEGVLAGLPDLFLPAGCKDFHGLYIEMKAPGRYPKPAQKEMIKNLRDQGYAVEVARSWIEGKEIIERYMSL